MERQRLPAHSQYCDAPATAAEHHATGWGLQGKFRTVRSHMDVVAVKSLLAALGEKRHTLREPLRFASSASRCCRRS